MSKQRKTDAEAMVERLKEELKQRDELVKSTITGLREKQSEAVDHDCKAYCATMLLEYGDLELEFKRIHDALNPKPEAEPASNR